MHTCLLSSILASAIHSIPIEVRLERPAGTLRIGDTPNFSGTVTNTGKTPLKGMVVYLSLVSLEPGSEQPVDLEGWSAEKAIRIDLMQPGGTVAHPWSMRLIQAGSFGVALTVIDPKEEKPVVSPLVRFDVQAKPALSSKRVFPVALGEPLLLLAALGAIGLLRQRKLSSQV
jgi:hypothetical protein